MAKLSGIPFYQAHGSNYTPGRNGNTIKYFTVHHSAGWESSLAGFWQAPNRNSSSHFWVGNILGKIEQYVDTDDTAWTNGNFVSNTQSITCEARGDWRNGFCDQVTLDNLSEIMFRALELYPNIALTFHQDVSNTFTLCPADIKHRGYAVEAWNKAKERLKPAPAPVPAPTPQPELVAINIPNKLVITIKDANLWDLGFSKWSDAKAVKVLPAGTQVEASAVVDHPLGGRYLVSEFSYARGIMNGVNVADIRDYVAPVTPTPTPPVVVIPPVVPVPEVPVVVEPVTPVVVEPVIPIKEDTESKTILEKIWKAIQTIARFFKINL